MFRSLFISLLILSALSSEGISSFPASFYSMYLADINTTSFCDSSRNVIEQMNNETLPEIKTSKALTGMDNGLFLLSSDTIEFLTDIKAFNAKNSNDINISKQFNNMDDVDYVLIDSIETKSSKYLKDIIVKYSDSSPPSCKFHI